MRKLFTIMLFGVIISSSSIFAQFFIPYFPTEHLEKAREEAGKVLTDPQLVSLATIKGTIPGLEIAGTPIPIDFDISDTESKGKSTAWIYIFNSTEQPDNFQAIAVAFSMVGVTPVNVTTMGLDLGSLAAFASSKSLDDVEWMNSSDMVGYLKASSPYTNFMNNYPNGITKYIVLGYADYANLDPDTPYWFVTMYDVTDSLLIVINALDGTVTDINESQVDYNGIKVYPNPAIDIININLPESLLNSMNSIILFNNQGKEISRFKAENNILNLDKYSNGQYLININGNGKNNFIPLIIQR